MKHHLYLTVVLTTYLDHLVQDLKPGHSLIGLLDLESRAHHMTKLHLVCYYHKT